MSLRQRSGVERRSLCCLITAPKHICPRLLIKCLVLVCVRAPPHPPTLLVPLRAEGKYHLLASQRHTRSERAASVMRSGEIKVREAAALHSEGPGRRQQRGTVEAKPNAAADVLRLPGDF